MLHRISTITTLLSLSIFIVLADNANAHTLAGPGGGRVHTHCGGDSDGDFVAFRASGGELQAICGARNELVTERDTEGAENVGQKYRVLESIPGVVNKGDFAPNFADYMRGIFTFGISIVGIAALVMITIGGFWYITSAGNQARTGTAKSIITDAFLGLFVALFAWLILNTINPNLVTGGMSALRSVAEGDASSQATTGTGGGDQGDEALVDQPIGNTDQCVFNVVDDLNCGAQSQRTSSSGIKKTVQDCDNCLVVSGEIFKNPGQGCTMSECRFNEDLARSLNTLGSSMSDEEREAFKDTWIVSEMWPPTTYHSNDCHYNGTCIDVSIDNNSNAAIIEYIRQAAASGLYVEYEVNSDQRRQELQTALQVAQVPGTIIRPSTSPNFKEHFSVYRNSNKN